MPKIEVVAPGHTKNGTRNDEVMVKSVSTTTLLTGMFAPSAADSLIPPSSMTE